MHNRLAYTSHIRDLESCNICTAREIHQLRINCRGVVIPCMFFFHSVIHSHFIIQSLPASTVLAEIFTVVKDDCSCHQESLLLPPPPPFGQFNLLHTLTTCSVAIHRLSTLSKELFTDCISCAFAAMALLSESCGDFYFCCNSFTCAHLRTDCSCT